MLDIGWTEMFVVAVVAIVVIGPKDLPNALRTVGRWTRRIRAAAREFQSSVDDMVNQAELDELRKSANEIRNFDANRYISDTVDPTGSAGPTGDGATKTGTEENSMLPPVETPASAQTGEGASDKPAASPQRETNA